MNNEKVYKVMSRTGVANIVLGTIIAAVSLAAGVLLIIGGTKLLRQKSKITF